MEKMTVKAQAEVRAKFYEMFGEAAQAAGYEVEPFKGGMLIGIGEGNFVKVNVAVANPEKFSIEDVRYEYAETLARRAERAEAAKQKAIEREEKARAKAEAAAEKVAE